MKNKKFEGIILDYCYENNYFETICALEKEGGINFEKLDKNLKRIKKKCIQGNYRELKKLLEIFKNVNKRKFDHIENLILKNEFLELITKKTSPEILLNKLENFTNENFEEMSEILSSNEYKGVFLDKNFPCIKIRYELFKEILEEMKNYYDIEENRLKGKYSDFVRNLNRVLDSDKLKENKKSSNVDIFSILTAKEKKFEKKNLYNSNFVQKIKSENISKCFSSAKKVKKKAILKKQNIRKNSLNKINNFFKKMKKDKLESSVINLESSEIIKKDFSFKIQFNNLVEHDELNFIKEKDNNENKEKLNNLESIPIIEKREFSKEVSINKKTRHVKKCKSNDFNNIEQNIFNQNMLQIRHKKTLSSGIKLEKNIIIEELFLNDSFEDLQRPYVN